MWHNKNRRLQAVGDAAAAKPAKLTKETRELLYEWPAGEERVYATTYYDTDRATRPTAEPPGCMLVDGLKKPGYLQLLSEFVRAPGSSDVVEVAKYTTGMGGRIAGRRWRRTEVPIRAPVTRTTESKDAAYRRNPKNKWPWSEARHMEVIETSTHAALRDITRKMSGHRADPIRLPLHVADNPTQLKYLRTQLEERFQHDDCSSSYAVPVLAYAQCTGAGIHMLLMQMLVQPQFKADGTFQRFVPIDPRRAHDEILRLTDNTGSIRTKYVTYLAQHPCARLLPRES